MPLVLMMAFDDVMPTFQTPYLLASMVVLTAGALTYVRSARTSQRVLALLTGMTLVWAVATVAPAIFWEGQMPGRMMELARWHVVAWRMIKDWAVLATLMFAPALLGLLRREVGSVRAG